MAESEVARLARELKLKEFVSRPFLERTHAGLSIHGRKNRVPGLIEEGCKKVCEQNGLNFEEVTAVEFIDAGGKALTLEGILNCGPKTRGAYQALLLRFDLISEPVEKESLSKVALELLELVKNRE